MPTFHDRTDPVQQAHAAYLTLYQALQALPADHPAAAQLAQLVNQAAQHWQTLQRAEETASIAAGAAITLQLHADSAHAA